jgi:acetylornithine deacetylase
MPQPRALDSIFDRDHITGILADLVRIDSRNPGLAPGAPGEAAIAEYCADWLRRHGVDAWVDEVAPGRCNAVGRVGSGAGPVLALCAHIDTVGTEGMPRALEPRTEEGRLHGLGAYDMKSGVLVVMAAMAALARRPLRGTVMAALVADEEFASMGAADYVARYPAGACIVTEPSEGRLVLAHKGFVWVEIETQGRAAHGSRWEEGVSAVGRMGRIVAALEAFDSDVLRARTHPLLGPASLHCAMIDGGEGWSTYAAACRLRVERRTLPGESTDRVLDEVRSVIAAAGESAAVRDVMDRPPLECPPESAVAEAVRAAAAEICGKEPDAAGVAYWMDAALFAAAGADTVDYGPSGAGAHAAEEWVDLDSVAVCARVLEEAARRYCA